jgi:hypothetical protein
MTNGLTPATSDFHETTPKQHSPGHFSLYSRREEELNRKVAKYIRRNFLATDYEEGYVYIAKDANSDLCKVGFARADADARIKAIEKCQVHTNSSVQVGPVKGAFRVERLVLTLLEHYCHVRQQCPCGLKNREWFRKDYAEVITQVQIVYRWMQNEPYELLEGDMTLKGVWSDALDKWQHTQETELPLSWNDFFIMGPSININMGGLCYHIPRPDAATSHSSSYQFGKQFLDLLGMSGLKKKNGPIKKFKHAKARFAKHAHGGASVSPAPNAPVSHDKRQDYSEDPEIWDTVDEYADSTPSRRPHSRPSDRTSAAKVADAGVDKPIEHTTPQKQIRGVDLANTSPLRSFQKDLPITSSPVTVCEPQQSLPDLDDPQDIDGSPQTEDNGAGGAMYHHEVTLSAPRHGDHLKECSEPASISPDRTHPPIDDHDMSDIVEMMARMPGAFPEDELENLSHPELSLIIFPRALFSAKDCEFHEMVEKELPSDAQNFAGTRTFLVDGNNFVILVPGSPPITEDLLLYAAHCMSAIALLLNEEKDSLSVKQGCQIAASVYPDNQASKAEAAGPIPTTKSLRDTHDGIALPNQDTFARRLRRTNEDNIPVPVCPTNATPSNEQPALSCGGTAWIRFWPVFERDPGFGDKNVYYQSICRLPWFSKFSFEELRLADYNLGLRFARQPVVDDNNASNEGASTTEARQKTGSHFASFPKSSPKSSLFSASSINFTCRPNAFGFQSKPVFPASNGSFFSFTPGFQTTPSCTKKPSVAGNKIFGNVSYEFTFTNARLPGKTSPTRFDSNNKLSNKANGDASQNTFSSEPVNEED